MFAMDAKTTKPISTKFTGNKPLVPKFAPPKFHQNPNEHFEVMCKKLFYPVNKPQELITFWLKKMFQMVSQQNFFAFLFPTKYLGNNRGRSPKKN